MVQSVSYDIFLFVCVCVLEFRAPGEWMIWGLTTALKGAKHGAYYIVQRNQFASSSKDSFFSSHVFWSPLTVD